MIEISISSAAAHFSQENNVFGLSFSLEFEWIERESFWMLHLYNDNQEPLVLGIKVQTDWPLYAYHRDKGQIIFMAMRTSAGKVLSRHTLKEHFSLVAYEAI